LATALSGTLLRAGWTPERVDRFVHVIATAARDEEAPQREKAEALAAKLTDKNGRVPGLPRLTEILGEKTVKRLRGWISLGAEPLFDAAAALVRITDPLPAPPMLVEGYLPDGACGGLTGQGGASKTTFALWEGVHLALGWPLFGREVTRSGGVLFVTAEDDKALLAYRLQQMAPDLCLGPDERRKLESLIYVEDVTGRMLRMVEADERGNLAPTAFGDRLIEVYKGHGLVLVNIDPTNLFGPGERFVNDAEASLMVEGQRIARELGCTVRFIHHISKSAARSGVVDQYASRGGASFADNSRFQHHLVRHEDEPDEDEDGQARKRSKSGFTPPDAIEPVALAEGRVLRLHTTKLSWAPLPLDPIWLTREGFRFDWHAPERVSRDERVKRRVLEEQRRVVAYVVAQLGQGVRLSVKQIAEEHHRALKLGRNDARRVVDVLLQKRHLKLEPLPKDQQQGARKEYLSPGLPLPSGEGF
jgi:hypothetical protein